MRKWKEATDSMDLSSDHTHALAGAAYAIMHVETLNKKKNK